MESDSECDLDYDTSKTSTTTISAARKNQNKDECSNLGELYARKRYYANMISNCPLKQEYIDKTNEKHQKMMEEKQFQQTQQQERMEIPRETLCKLQKHTNKVRESRRVSLLIKNSDMPRIISEIPSPSITNSVQYSEDASRDSKTTNGSFSGNNGNDIARDTITDIKNPKQDALKASSSGTAERGLLPDRRSICMAPSLKRSQMLPSIPKNDPNAIQNLQNVECLVTSGKNDQSTTNITNKESNKQPSRKSQPASLDTNTVI
jgi:hypothetical protein